MHRLETSPVHLGFLLQLLLNAHRGPRTPKASWAHTPHGCTLMLTCTCYPTHINTHCSVCQPTKEHAAAPNQLLLSADQEVVSSWPGLRHELVFVSHTHPKEPSLGRGCAGVCCSPWFLLALWLLAGEGWPGPLSWAGLQAEVRVSCELIWAGCSQQICLPLLLPVRELEGAIARARPLFVCTRIG